VPDLLLPGSATNVTVVDLGKNKRITFSFAGPGEDGDRRTPVAYEVRYADSANNLNQENFKKADLVPKRAMESGSFAPVRPGANLEVTLNALLLTFGEKYTAVGQEVFIALLAIDEAGNEGPVSEPGSAYVSVEAFIEHSILTAL